MTGDLSVQHAGAEVLVQLAQERAFGELEWVRPSGTLKIQLAAGRPEQIVDTRGQANRVRKDVVRVLRAFAVTLEGRFAFAARPVSFANSLSIDTLGEAFLALAMALPENDVAAMLQARGDASVETTPSFARLAAAAVSLRLPPPVAPVGSRSLRELTYDRPLAAQRVWLALLLLGGLQANASVRSTASSLPQSGKESAAAPLPTDPEARARVSEIRTTFAQLANGSHYDALGVARGASVEDIRQAYFAMAKRWHADSFAGLDLGTDRATVDDIFRRLGEAYQVLSNVEERKTYDFLLARHEQGLPTDPQVIIEAETLFKRGQGLIRRGQATAALPILQRALELNRGEAEFHVYVGFATYCAQGSAAVNEARAHIQRGLEIRDDLDAAYEFLGRIARVEGDKEEAVRQLKTALEINPKNADAERELRLLSMREKRDPNEPKSMAELFGRWFKRGS